MVRPGYTDPDTYKRPKRTKRHNQWLWDNGQRRCAYCGRPLKRNQMTTDHVKPLSSRGYDKKSNIVACCYPCNQAKGRMSADEFLKMINAK